MTLFVYGTLMRGGVHHRVLADQRFLGEARTRPHYALLNLGDHPGLVHRSEGGVTIHGELYEVAESLIEELDRLEEAPILFRLARVFMDGDFGDVFAYFYQHRTEGFAPYAGGRWRNEESAHDT